VLREPSVDVREQLAEPGLRGAGPRRAEQAVQVLEPGPVQLAVGVFHAAVPLPELAGQRPGDRHRAGGKSAHRRGDLLLA
jgi:hypothetical protein